MDIRTAAAILCEVHTEERDGLLCVQIGAGPGYWYPYDRYIEAWETLHAFTKPASPAPGIAPSGAETPESSPERSR